LWPSLACHAGGREFESRLSEEQAREVANTVIEFIKGKLPGPIASQLDGLISEGGGVLGTITGALGGLFGKKE